MLGMTTGGTTTPPPGAVDSAGLGTTTVVVDVAVRIDVMRVSTSPGTETEEAPPPTGTETDGAPPVGTGTSVMGQTVVPIATTEVTTRPGQLVTVGAHWVRVKVWVE